MLNSDPLQRIFRSTRHTLQRTAADGTGGGPDFICIGQAKAGTGWLLDQMKARQDVWMPPVKEINFLSGTNRKPANAKLLGVCQQASQEYAKVGAYKDAVKRPISRREHKVYDFDWYRRLFDPKGERKSGDISPSYANLSPKRAAAAAESLPECRFILLLREPVSRLWSSLCMDVRMGRLDPDDITDWTRLNNIVIRRRRQLRRKRPTRISLASTCWRIWSAAVPAKRIRFWFFDDIVMRPADVRDEICSFVGLSTDPGAFPADYNRKRDAAKIDMPMEIRNRLVELFEREYEDCAEIFGGHAVSWMSRAAMEPPDAKRDETDHAD